MKPWDELTALEKKLINELAQSKLLPLPGIQPGISLRDYLASQGLTPGEWQYLPNTDNPNPAGWKRVVDIRQNRIELHKQTYDIVDIPSEKFPDEAAAQKAGYTIPLNPKQAEELRGMNRAERRKWAAKNRKSKR
jgi:hypothetical protein